MNKKTGGAWIIHHTKKLQQVTEVQDFEDIELAGKCGIFLSNLAASEEQSDLNKDKILAIAKSSNIKKIELDTIKNKLAEFQYIELGKNESLSVLGITTATVLSHTSEIFLGAQPSNYQKAALEISDNISNLPKEEKVLTQYIGDTFALSKSETADLLSQSETIGFIDFEPLDISNKFYFNGNLFRKDVIKKTNAILNSLKADEAIKVSQLDTLLSENGCVTFENGKLILGEQLLSKMQSIGMYDFNEVSNSSETKTFITKPSAFSKFGNPFEEDALDLAKAFVSALYYGMTYSSPGRGRITLLRYIMRNLINGYEVGPATAIGEDYKILELKRVIQVRHAGGSSSRYFMRLLKKDIGELAMQVLEYGEASEKTMVGTTLPSGNLTNYNGPEYKRVLTRKKQTAQSKTGVANMLRTFRA